MTLIPVLGSDQESRAVVLSRTLRLTSEGGADGGSARDRRALCDFVRPASFLATHRYVPTSDSAPFHRGPPDAPAVLSLPLSPL